VTGDRFYGDLAPWWPLISPVEDYAEEAEYTARLLRSAQVPVREVLELGSGGGHNAAHLKRHFSLTLVDLSGPMLEQSRRLNPECEHLRGDMRSLRLGRTFDAVFIHDAIDYMTSLPDLRAALETAYLHCRPGGIAVVMPDHIRETFQPGTDHGGSDGPDGGGARYLEWTRDPGGGETVEIVYAFLLRRPDGTVETAHETHRIGLFSRRQWLDLLIDVGFRPEMVTEETSEEREPRQVFVGRV
jgi:SAM-dependent methyltransferase